MIFLTWDSFFFGSLMIIYITYLIKIIFATLESRSATDILQTYSISYPFQQIFIICSTKS